MPLYSDSASNFEFPKMTSEWVTYLSSKDKTNVAENVWVKGSKNMYKKLSGTIANRPGQKRLGEANTADSPISSHFVWNTSWGATRTLVVSDSKLSVVIDNVWYTLLSGLTSTRYVFDKWWSATEQKDRVIFVHGTSDIQDWSGGFTTIASATNNTGIILTISDIPDAGGTGYTVGDILDITTGVGGQVKVLTLGASNAATTVELVTHGTGYSVSASNATSGGSGTGATITILSVGTGTLTKNTPASTWVGDGFSSSTGEKKIMILGTEYTYIEGEDGVTLYGVTPDPSAIPADSVALQSVITRTDTPAAGFMNDFLKVINNQNYVGSYTSRLCYISKNTSFINFTVPASRVAGDPNLLTLDATLNGISIRQGNPYISFGTDSWAEISYNNLTVGTDVLEITNVVLKPIAVNQAAYAHEFISSVGDNIVYLAKDQQIRVVGDFNNAFTPRYPSFSQAIATELMAEDFGGGSLSCVGEFIYLSAPSSGNVYLRQERTSVDNTGTPVLEIIWHSPFIWNLTAVDSINGVVVGFSNANPQIYQLWDTDQWYDNSPSNEALPYSCVLALGYRGEQRRQGLWSFDKNFTEGYCTLDTELNLTMNYNYQGSTSQTTSIVNSPDQPATFFGTSDADSPASLGDSSLGDETLGESDSGDEDDVLKKFKCINSLALINCFEWQPIFSTDQVGARWEILATATNAQFETEQQATFLINKP